MSDAIDGILESLKKADSPEEVDPMVELAGQARSAAGRKLLDAIKSDDSDSLIQVLLELKDMD